jgi:hypothetical protein
VGTSPLALPVPRVVDHAAARRAIGRRVANVFPGCRAEFVEDLVDGSIGFVVIDERGRTRTNVVRVYSPRQRFTKVWLMHAVSAAGGRVGYPRLRLG